MITHILHLDDFEYFLKGRRHSLQEIYSDICEPEPRALEVVVIDREETTVFFRSPDVFS